MISFVKKSDDNEEMPYDLAKRIPSVYDIETEARYLKDKTQPVSFINIQLSNAIYKVGLMQRLLYKYYKTASKTSGRWSVRNGAV